MGEKLDRELSRIKGDYEKSIKLVANLQDKYFEADSARESLIAKVEALEATAANLNASIATACGNLSSAAAGPLSKEGADVGAVKTESAEDGVTPDGSIATQTSFLGDVQEQLKAFQSQFDSIKTTIQGEPDSEKNETKAEEAEEEDGAAVQLTPVDEQEHLIRQARFGEELTNLDNVLKQKELQLKKMKSGEEEMDNIRHKYEES